MVRELDGTPVTVKIRVLETGVAATVAFAQMLEACGASAVCVHGRTVKQNKQLCGSSDGDVARQVSLLLLCLSSSPFGRSSQIAFGPDRLPSALAWAGVCMRFRHVSLLPLLHTYSARGVGYN